MIKTHVSSPKIHQNETMSTCKLTNFLAYKWPPILRTSYNILNSKQYNQWLQNQSAPLFLYVPTSCSVYKLGTNLQFWALYHHSCKLQSMQLLKQVLLTSNCRYTRQTAKYISNCTVCLVHAMKAHRGSRRIPPFIFNVGGSWRWADNFTLQPLYIRKEHPYALNRSRSGCFAEENFFPLTRIRMPDRPAGSVVTVPTTPHQLPCEILVLCYF